MIELQGKYNTAKVFTDNIENEAISQIIDLCNQEFVQGSKIRIMPDTHAGAGCTIGTTMTINDKIVPNLVGVDIGCGVLLQKIHEKDVDLAALDKAIRASVPSGQSIREHRHELVGSLKMSSFLTTNLRCKSYVDIDRALLSIGTLGGGNHFIEANKDSEGNIYIAIHSGSRYLGKQVATHYQNIAFKKLSEQKDVRDKLIAELKAAGREKEIQNELKKMQPIKIRKDLAYLEGEDFDDYICDIDTIQYYAHINRVAILQSIMKTAGLNLGGIRIESVHNYIDVDEMILRKGAINAQAEEYLVIPINMKDGSIIGRGKGNEDWNNSAPHGAGRLMSRSKAKEILTMEDYKSSMEGIYSTSIKQSTLDEAPGAYKPIDEILENIKDSVEIIEIIKPIYSFKASEDDEDETK